MDLEETLVKSPKYEECRASRTSNAIEHGAGCPVKENNCPMLPVYIF